MIELSPMTDTAPATRRADDAPVRFGVIGAGFIARWFAEAVSHEPAATRASAMWGRPIVWESADWDRTSSQVTG